MSGRIVAGVVGFVVLVLIIQTYVLGDDNPATDNLGRTGAAPTATLPAQLPEPISLGEQTAGGSSGATGSTGSPSTYVVQSGDTLGTIATSFNVAPEAQAEWINDVLELNALADARQLQAGQELQLPAVPAAPTPTPGGATGSTGATGATGPTGPTGVNIATATPTGAAGDGDVYIVESGDTPLDIAGKFCVENPTAWANELVALNGIDAGNLAVGDELELPAGTSEC